MRGKTVLHPMGWDAFGLPAEQHAIKTGTHPRTTTYKNIDTFRRQLQMLGFSYDWSREFSTTDPDYFRWTQWIFLTIFDTWFDATAEWTDPDGEKHQGAAGPIAELPIPEDMRRQGDEAVRRYQDKHRLAYQTDVAGQLVPCPGDRAGQRRGDRRKERTRRASASRVWPCGNGCCGSPSTPSGCWRDSTSWTGASRSRRCSAIGSAAAKGPKSISSSANRRTRRRRTRPLPSGKERGPHRTFPKEPGDDVLRIYTTRPDTLFGATYMVLAPEHPFVDRLTTSAQKQAVEQYRQAAAGKSDLDRTDLAKQKTGVFTGTYALNPVNGKKMPIWIADYVLISYGTGAIMAVPAHDLRDWEFAVQFDLPIIPVVKPPDGYEPTREEAALARTVNDRKEFPFVGQGTAINSGVYDRMPTAEFKTTITNDLAEIGARPSGRQLPAARLALQPAALLGGAFPDLARAGRGRKSDRPDAQRAGERTARHAAGNVGLQALGQAGASAGQSARRVAV